MKKVNVFSKKLDKTFVLDLNDENNVCEDGATFDDLYSGEETDSPVRKDWNSWSNQGWNNWGAICV